MATRASKKSRLYGVKPKNAPTGYNRVRSADEYHTARWTKESKSFRARHPLCEACERKGVVAASEVVDHIVPFPVCPDFWDSRNWQALCKKHNAEKGNKDKKIIAEFKNNTR